MNVPYHRVLRGKTMPTSKEERFVVFYTHQDHSDHEFHFFTHEADVLLGTLATLVFDKKLKPQEAFGAWERYRQLEPTFYEDEDDWEGGFPGATGEFEPHVSEAFYEECLALGLEGVRDDVEGASPASGRIFEVRDKESLQRLSHKLRDQYLFVYHEIPDFMYPSTIDEAERMIGDARLLLVHDFYQRLRDRIHDWLESHGEGFDYAEILLVAPDLIHLLCKLVLDPDVPKSEKAKLAVAISYFISPIDAIPEALVGPIGYLDDIAVACFVLNGLLNKTPEEVVVRNWAGQTNILELIEEVLSVADEMIGAGLWRRIRRFVRGA